MRYLDCRKDSFAWKLRQLLADGSAAIDPAVGQFWHELIGDSPPCLYKEIQRAALPFCGWVYGVKEKVFLACLPPRLLKRHVELYGSLLCDLDACNGSQDMVVCILFGRLCWFWLAECISGLVMHTTMVFMSMVGFAIEFGSTMSL